MTTPVVPIPITAAPPVPNSSDPEATFDAQFEASLAWQAGDLRTGANALADATYTNAVAAVEAAAAADADRVQTGLDRIQTGLDAAATAADRVQTGLDRTAAADSAVQASKLNLGNKATAPTVDNQGAALLAGATYYDTTLNKWRVWTGSAWGDGISAISGVSSVNGLTGDVVITVPTPLPPFESGVI